MSGIYLSNSFGPAQRRRVKSGEYAGWFVSPSTRGIPAGIRDGDPWAGDCDRFTGVWDPRGYVDWLHSMTDFAGSCLFMVCPDVVGDWRETLADFEYWFSIIVGLGFPVAFVGQDGQPVDRVPWWTLDTYFVGGRDGWKDSAESMAIVTECRRRRVPVHVGRCNTRPRLQAFLNAYRGNEAGIPARFTVDGNGWRYPGKMRELAPAFATLRMRRLL